MTAIISGNTLGLVATSLNTLGASSAGGSARLGNGGESVYVDIANGNLVLQNQDELLVSRGLDLNVLRTYNSQGSADGVNNDNWRIGFYRQVGNLAGSINAAGSQIERTEADGAVLVYHWNGSSYVNTDGAGSADTLSFNSGAWTWTDGDSQLTET